MWQLSEKMRIDPARKPHSGPINARDMMFEKNGDRFRRGCDITEIEAYNTLFNIPKMETNFLKAGNRNGIQLIRGLFGRKQTAGM